MKNLNQNKVYNRAEFEKLTRSDMPAEGLDEFERDALEGWKENAASFELLKKTDRRYLGNKKMLWAVVLIAPISLLIYIGVIFMLEKQETESREKGKTYPVVYQSLVEKTDVETPQQIRQLEPIAKKKIIPAKTLQENFQEKKLEPEQKSEERPNENPQIKLETREVGEVRENLPAKTESRNSKAAEMYVNDLLIVDYRKYRTKAAIKTEQAIITGTPANMESIQSEIEESDWKRVDIPYIDYISKSMGIFARGNYKKALARYLEILKTYPDDLNASFYGALCYYNLGEFEQASFLFSACQSHKFNNFYEEASWYGAKSLIALKETEKARIRLEEIVAHRGFYAEKAKNELEKLKK